MPETAERKPVDWEAVKALAMVVGVREAARRMELSEEQVKKRCTREGWLSDPVARQAASNGVALRSGISPTVPMSPMSPAALIAQELACLSSKTRLGHARAAVKVAEHVESLSGPALLANAQDVKATVQTASTVFAWQDQAPAARLRIDVLNTAQREVVEQPVEHVIDIESVVIEGDTSDDL